MDFFGKLNSKNAFGMFEQGKGNNIVNIICGILLIILIIVLIVCLVRKNDNFSDSKLNNRDNCDIFMFDREGCGFSAKMKKMVQDNNNMIGNMKVCIIDMTKEQDLAQKYDVSGTPTFALKDDPSVISVGFAPLEVHEEKLKKKNNMNSKKHKLIGSDGCPFCQKAYKLLSELNIDYEKIDSNSHEGMKLMKEGSNGKGVNGVPYMICADGKEILGYNEEEYKNLKK